MTVLDMAYWVLMRNPGEQWAIDQWLQYCEEEVMKFNIADIKVIEVSPEEKEKSIRMAWSYAQRDGFAACRLGIPVERCPPFANSDLAVSWRMGWSTAHQRDEARKRGDTALLWPFRFECDPPGTLRV
jgi:hypothetical protein